MKQPLISIVIPVYAAGDYLESMTSQLSQQTLDDYEILFINDGSPDRSREIIQNLAKSDSRIRYFEHAHNRGQGAARNTGLEHASGEFVMYIDADDSFAPNYLERMVAAIEQDQADVAVCNSIWEFPDKREKRNMFLTHPKTDYRLLTGEETLRRYFQIYEHDMWIPVVPWGKIIRRSLIESHHIRHKEALFEDIVMTFNEIILAKKLAFISDYLYYYNNKNVRAATVERQKHYIREVYRMPEGIWEVLDKHGSTEALQKYATLFYFRAINGAYSFFANRQRLPEDFRYAVEKYGNMQHKLVIEDKDRLFILGQMKGFYFEMKQNDLSELFFLFLSSQRVQLIGMIMEAIPQSLSGRRECIHAIKTIFRAAKAVLLNPALLVKR